MVSMILSVVSGMRRNWACISERTFCFSVPVWVPSSPMTGTSTSIRAPVVWFRW